MGKRGQGNERSACGVQGATGLTSCETCRDPGMGPGRVAVAAPLRRKEEALFLIMHPLCISLPLGFYSNFLFP